MTSLRYDRAHVSITDEQKDRFLQDVVACYAPGHPMQAVVEAVYMMLVD